MPDYDPRIPRCDRKPTLVVVYNPDGQGDRWLPYCQQHADAFTLSLLKRKTPFTLAEAGADDRCTAYKDLE